jgi:hypothetical protein
VLKFDLDHWDAREAFKGEAPEQTWLIGGIMPRGVAGLLAAAGDTGKSFTALEPCLQVTRGHDVPGLLGGAPILGGQVKSHGAAVFITAEDGQASMHRRLRALDSTGQKQEKRQYPLYVVPLPDAGGPFPIVTEERNKAEITPQFKELCERLRAIPDLALVVLDPLQCFVHADINMNPQAAALTMSYLNTLAAETGAIVLVTHHARKEGSPKNSQQARLSIRGTTALVDQSRFAIALWVPEEAQVKKDCERLGAEYKPNAIVYGAVVKSNDGASREKWITLRGPDGVLRDVTADLIKKHVPKDELHTALVDAIASAAGAGKPYTKTAGNGLYKRRSELGEVLAAQSRARLEGMADELLIAGKIVQASATGSKAVQWLDVPTGEFAKGEGEFAPGANISQGGRKPCE